MHVGELKQSIHKLAILGVTLCLALLVSCAANPRVPKSTTTSSNQYTTQNADAAALMGARVSFHYADYYSLASPKYETSCAGDAKTYYDPIATIASAAGYTPAPYETHLMDSTMTIRPGFIKNVSVDITDANAPVSTNNASACSFGNASNVPAPSNCATFDYGAIGGIPTTLSGTLFLVGGITNKSSIYALGIDSLPASAATDPPSALAPGLTSASGPISTWANLSAATASTGPQGLIGASAAYNSNTQRAIVFGGSSSTAPGGSADTWNFDLNTQLWSLPANDIYIDNAMTYVTDYNGTSTYLLSKFPGALKLFGYTAAQGMALTKMSTNGLATANIDTTDRVMIVGGIGATSIGTTTRRFNPTYGPDFVDTLGRVKYDTNDPAGYKVSTPAAGYVVQWLDSYHTQVMSNYYSYSSNYPTFYTPDFPSAGAPNFSYNFGIAPLRDNTTGAGFLLTAGGFDPNIATNTNCGPSDPGPCVGGAMMIGYKMGGLLGSGGFTGLTATSNFSGVTNLLDATENTPTLWGQLNEDTRSVPWYGGAALVPGFNLANNEVVYFGGASCRDYLTSTTASCRFENTGIYISMGATPINNTLTTPTTKPNTSSVSAWNTTVSHPKPNAGMTIARGLDPASNVIIVSWGGMQAAGTPDNSGSIYYLYNNGGTPTWVTAPTTGAPSGLGNAQLVFSHVTRKFYLFGGYTGPGSNYTSGDTWELSITGACTGVGTCTFAWTQLNTSGLTCSPNCPGARYSHRMVEVNYHNRNPAGESTCGADQPCSYGIFMEGGTTNGLTLLSDRWLFDPTANSGKGHWQQMSELPPRAFSAMTSLDYYVNSTSSTAHRALMFGGETGLSNPGATFIPPTLGDTYMYDFDDKTWNRVTLLGKGYNGAPSAFSSEWEKRQAYDATPVDQASRDLSELTPPPISGAVMVTRTFAGSTPLKIPEVYLFGGRKKDGSYNTLDGVYKFCAGSTGERTPLPLAADTYNTGVPDDAQCDVYDSNVNPYSSGPSDKFVGRWLRKRPPTVILNPSQTGSFKGAGAYDSVRDRIILVGGRGYAQAVTSANPGWNTDANGLIVYEYTAPTNTKINGSPNDTAHDGQWEAISSCDTNGPVARYGHSLGFDPLTQQIIMVGGYSSSGTLLTQDFQSLSSPTYQIPQVWAAKRETNCYRWRQIDLFGNSPYITSQAPPLTGLSHAAGFFISRSGYNSGYYSMFDRACIDQGPISSGDPLTSKLLAGGVYFDVDRSVLGPNENLLLNLTYLPMGPTNQNPDSTQVTTDQAAIFKIHLVKTGQPVETLQSILQPRYLTYAATDQYPQVVQTLTVLTHPTGQARQEQVLLPISIDSAIDRIRIERYSGSGILIDASLMRMGYR